MDCLLSFVIGFSIGYLGMTLFLVHCVDYCADPSQCKYGTTPDAYGCCEQCLKGPGEKCGGPGNKDGVCAAYLFCAREPECKSRVACESNSTETWEPVTGIESGLGEIGICRERSKNYSRS